MNTMNKAFGAVTVTLVTFIVTMQMAGADVLTDQVTAAQTQVVGYATTIGPIIGIVALAWVAVRLIPRAIRMVAARFGG